MVTNSFGSRLYPQNFDPAISRGEKWWQTVLEGEFSCCQWEGSGCTHEQSSFSLF